MSISSVRTVHLEVREKEDARYRLPRKPFEGQEVTVVVQHCSHENGVGMVVGPFPFQAVSIYPGSESQFRFQEGRWIQVEHVYGILQSMVMHNLYRIRSEKLMAGESTDAEDGQLDKAWRCKANERNYYGLKETSPPVDGIEKQEKALLGFYYKRGPEGSRRVTD